jgi:dynein heavy chain
MANDNPVIKAWVVYRSIEDTIKNMSIVLPLINDLHSPAMRDRHWKNLAKVCGVKSIDPNDGKFTFEDAFGLKVHEHAEDVEEIVETANKELKIERNLKNIETTWRDMTMAYCPHNDTDMFLIRPSEEVN